MQSFINEYVFYIPKKCAWFLYKKSPYLCNIKNVLLFLNGFNRQENVIVIYKSNNNATAMNNNDLLAHNKYAKLPTAQ